LNKKVPLLKPTRNQVAIAILFCFWAELAYLEPIPKKINPDSIFVVVNSANPQSRISQPGLNAIFNMRLRHWSDESPITVFVLQDDDPLHKAFCKQKLHLFSHQRVEEAGTGWFSAEQDRLR
jgi:hypothetical protein